MIDIVPLSYEHLPQIVLIERQSFSDPWSHDFIMKFALNPYAIALCALEDEGVSGFIVVRQVEDEADILKIAVHPERRGNGIGKALASYAVDILRKKGCAKTFLEVRQSNEAALTLYKGIGFKTLGVRKGYYKAPSEDALQMGLVF